MTTYCSEFSNCLQIGVDKVVPRKFSKNKFTNKLKNVNRKFYSKSVLSQQAKSSNFGVLAKNFQLLKIKQFTRTFPLMK